MKRLVALFLVLLLSIESFAAVVSDNDGSAFITKAEFDSLKNNFQSQINQYNTSIDSKIDGAIAAYLSGLQVSKEVIVKGNNDFLDFPLMYEKQDYIRRRIINTGGIYNEALIKFGTDIWELASRQDEGGWHYVRDVSGKATTGYVATRDSTVKPIVTGRYQINRFDFVAAGCISYNRSAADYNRDGPLTGVVWMDFKPASWRTTRKGLYATTNRQDGTSYWSFLDDGTEVIRTYGNTAYYYGDLAGGNYYGKGQDTPIRTPQDVMSVLYYCNPNGSRQVNMQETIFGNGYSFEINQVYYDNINTWSDGGDGIADNWAVVQRGDINGTGTNAPCFRWVSRKNNRQPYYANNTRSTTAQYWNASEGGAPTTDVMNRNLVIYMIDFGPTLKKPASESNYANRNLIDFKNLRVKNKFEANEFISNMNGGIPICNVTDGPYTEKGKISLNLSANRYSATAEKPYLFLSKKEIKGDTKDEILNNTNNELFNFGVEKYVQVSFDNNKEYNFTFDGELTLNDKIYIKFGWTVSQSCECIQINSNPVFTLYTG